MKSGKTDILDCNLERRRLRALSVPHRSKDGHHDPLSELRGPLRPPDGPGEVGAAGDAVAARPGAPRQRRWIAE